MLNEIKWPYGYLPGTTDNFASNEIIAKVITAKDVFEDLIDTSIFASNIELL
ncbi:hypothetical protein [Lachnoanaerobaculum sp.]